MPHKPTTPLFQTHTDSPLGQVQQFELHLQPASGIPFQLAVWKALQQIPFGQTCTYGDLARGMGNTHAARAVGAAIGQNLHSIVVPCHRVMGANGSLKYLLAHEASHL